MKMEKFAKNMFCTMVVMATGISVCVASSPSSLVGGLLNQTVTLVTNTITYPNSSVLLNAATTVCGGKLTGQCSPTDPADLVFDSNPFEAPTETWKINMTAQEKVEYEGYNAVNYTVTTPDGYQLFLLRIVNVNPNATPCLLVHGSFQSANDWVVQPNKSSLAMRLADSNGDVWILSLRGTTGSQGHTSKVSDADYWGFSVDTQIKYDLPTVIDFILNTTGHSSLVYFGYSLGGTLGLGLLASQPTYNAKIRNFVGIHSPAYHGNTTSAIWRLGGCLVSEFPIFGEYEGSSIPDEFDPAIWTVLTVTTYTLCQEYDYGQCGQFLNSVFGKTGHPANETYDELLPVVTPYFPNQESWQTLVQTLWDIQKPVFSYFDYGPEGNMAAYNGSKIPPRYDISKVTTNVTLYCSTCDSVVDLKDCQRLVDGLPNPPKYFKMANFNHIDPFYGRHIQQFYDHVIGQVAGYLSS